MTQLESAKKGKITPEMVQAAHYDNITPEELLCRVGYRLRGDPEKPITRL